MELITEKSNEKTKNIDKKSTMDMLRIMNEEDKNVAYAVERELPNIEGAEDNIEAGKEALENINLTKIDTVVGITASGNTPYVLGAIEYANSIGATTVGLSCNKNSQLPKMVKIPITPIVGSEVITGSTRLKAGTAQKMVLNMLITVSMIGIGKVYGNLMVDLNPSNEKLIDRSKRIIMEATSVDEKKAERYLELSENSTKIAIVIIETNCNYKEATDLLDKFDGSIYKSIIFKLSS